MIPPKSVNITNLDGAQSVVNYYGTPDECPMCHRGTNPRVAFGVTLGPPAQPNTALRITFQCTWANCMETFFGYYDARADSQSGGYSYFFQRVAPKEPQKAIFPDSISEVSPSFVAIYNQAMAAEAVNLDQISGIGLRRALEFLVKDFLIHEKPNDAETIKQKFLGACINEDIEDANVKACAARATWLGNDETHYVRKWIDKDINDLKTLIRLTVNWIDNVLLTQGYLKDMDPPTKVPTA